MQVSLSLLVLVVLSSVVCVLSDFENVQTFLGTSCSGPPVSQTLTQLMPTNLTCTPVPCQSRHGISQKLVCASSPSISEFTGLISQSYKKDECSSDVTESVYRRVGTNACIRGESGSSYVTCTATSYTVFRCNDTSCANCDGSSIPIGCYQHTETECTGDAVSLRVHSSVVLVALSVIAIVLL
eukprot:TRINITY_DN2089_c0_g2_i1.p1 TRINITY_DN2089_c0_g2~~TRINITY_DN2089_c0_g2_i1.p1  ORF type:complete len:183 (+),score=23.16 TRINITY_DN2089_c0_g2_i1:52-600(+)